jgi:hypothetical protein
VPWQQCVKRGGEEGTGKQPGDMALVQVCRKSAPDGRLRRQIIVALGAEHAVRSVTSMMAPIAPRTRTLPGSVTSDPISARFSACATSRSPEQ